MAEEQSAPSLAGKWHHVRSEHFEDFLRENGANFVVRKLAASSNPTVDITRDGDKVSIILHSMFTTRNVNFTVGEPYEETQHNGTVMQVTPSWDGDNKLVLDYQPKVADTGKPQKHVREVNGDELVMTMQIGDVTAKRYFKRAS